MLHFVFGYFEMVQHNYELGARYYSYRTLERRLAALVDQCLGA